MFIYCTTIWVDCPPTQLFSLIANWLSTQLELPVEAADLQRDTRRDAYLHKLYVTTWRETYPRLTAIHVAYPAGQVSGLQWELEVGLRQDAPQGEIACSILLQTSAASPRVPPVSPVLPPGLVYELMQRCAISTRTPGHALITLDEDNAHSLRRRITFAQRRAPILIISPREAGGYAVAVEALYRQLAGLAEVFVIAEGTDPFAIRSIIGAEHAPYNGAINIIYPPGLAPDEQDIPNYRYLADRLAALQADGGDLIMEIVGEVTHKMNRPNAERHISAATIEEYRRRHELETRREPLDPEESSELLHILNEVNKELTDERNALAAENARLRQQVELLEQELNAERARYRGASQTAALSAALRALQWNPAFPTERARFSQLFADAISRGVQGQLVPYDMLIVLAGCFPERLVVLPSALESAQQAARFERRARLAELLWRLPTTYYDHMRAGLGDRAAVGKVWSFRNFAPKESETVMQSKRGRELRTFEYNGQMVEMWRHLKLGNKQDAVSTIRVHFHWDDENSKVVIGYCGPHLDY